MTVFKTFWKILNKNKVVVIIYTVILLLFGISNMQTSEQNLSFTPKKPDVLIINEDENTEITKNLIDYIQKNTNLKNVENTEEAIDDAVFYREVNYVIYIPENYTQDFLNGQNPEIKVKSTGDYQSAYAEMMVARYLQVANLYQGKIENREELITKINEVLENEVKVEVTTKLDTTALEKASYYYNFASYSLLACLIMIIGLILNSFNEEKIRKRIVISNTNYKKHNRILLLSNCCYSLVLWLFYVIASFILLGKIMLSQAGLIYILNSLVFVLCVTALSFLLGTLVTNKNALSGISNVVSLGSSFLCGAFIPIKWLPPAVIKVAHALPTYYYIKTNESLKTIENFNQITMKPIWENMLIILAFTVAFVVLTNIVSKKKRKIG
ncbi:MAG: ABC transporter permease [Clostridia bacterium]|nr:ABC transporter permease [Clostridia bacterium]